MPEDSMILGIVLVSALVTLALRALPFTATALLHENTYLNYLKENMPLGVTLLLVAYTFKDIQLFQLPYGILMFSATVLLLVCYVCTRRTVLSIFVGLGWHILLVNSPMLSILGLSS